MLKIPIIIYINLKLLYNYFIKLNIINKKKLIINIISLRKVYKKKEIFKV